LHSPVYCFSPQPKQFDGQLFLVYLIVYAAGRSVLELFRGDLDRGFLIDNVLSNSQFISLLIIGVAIYSKGRCNAAGEPVTFTV